MRFARSAQSAGQSRGPPAAVTPSAAPRRVAGPRPADSETRMRRQQQRHHRLYSDRCDNGRARRLEKALKARAGKRGCSAEAAWGSSTRALLNLATPMPLPLS
eukprot:350290-Chlamydomonas_euryale.AAC.1